MPTTTQRADLPPPPTKCATNQRLLHPRRAPLPRPSRRSSRVIAPQSEPRAQASAPPTADPASFARPPPIRASAESGEILPTWKMGVGRISPLVETISDARNQRIPAAVRAFCRFSAVPAPRRPRASISVPRGTTFAPRHRPSRADRSLSVERPRLGKTVTASGAGRTSPRCGAGARRGFSGGRRATGRATHPRTARTPPRGRGT